jgi:hypothetical protein
MANSVPGINATQRFVEDFARGHPELSEIRHGVRFGVRRLVVIGAFKSGN